MEQWNRRYGLWVQKGAKGIAVIDEDYTDRTRLKFYFDYSDTRPGNVKSVKPSIWDMPSNWCGNVTYITNILTFIEIWLYSRL